MKTHVFKLLKRKRRPTVPKEVPKEGKEVRTEYERVKKDWASVDAHVEQWRAERCRTVGKNTDLKLDLWKKKSSFGKKSTFGKKSRLLEKKVDFKSHNGSHRCDL